MKYNPNIHHRRSIRLKGYDYSQTGLYFVTICCQDKICRFGKIENSEMILNDFGEIAHNEWVQLSEQYPHAFFDIFQIMPNHIHGIIALDTVATKLLGTYHP
jgi:REP element-mobilizing transposase RayT